MKALKHIAIALLCATSLQLAQAKGNQESTQFIKLDEAQYASLVKDIKNNPKAEINTEEQVQRVVMAGQKGELSYHITQEGHPAHPALIMLSLHNGAGKSEKNILIFSPDANKENAAKIWATQY